MTAPNESQVPSTLPSPDLEAAADVAKPLVSPVATSASHEESDKTSIARTHEPTKQQESVSADVHSYMRGFISGADQKAAFFFAGATALLAFLHSKNVAVRWVKSPTSWSISDALACIATVGLAASAVIMLLAVFPRLGGDQRGILFFRAISKYPSGAEYADDVLRRSDLDLVRTRLHHTYDLAKVCATKYRLLQAAFWVASVGLIATLVFFAVA